MPQQKQQQDRVEADSRPGSAARKLPAPPPGPGPRPRASRSTHLGRWGRDRQARPLVALPLWHLDPRGTQHSGPSLLHLPTLALSPSDALSGWARGGQRPQQQQQHIPPRALPSSGRPWHCLALLSWRQRVPGPGPGRRGEGPGLRQHRAEGTRLAPCPTLLRAGLPLPTHQRASLGLRTPICAAAEAPLALLPTGPSPPQRPCPLGPTLPSRVWSRSLTEASPGVLATRPCCPPRPRQGPSDRSSQRSGQHTTGTGHVWEGGEERKQGKVGGQVDPKKGVPAAPSRLPRAQSVSGLRSLPSPALFPSSSLWLSL